VSRCPSNNCTGMIRDEEGTNQSTLWSQKFGTVKITFHSERWSLVTFVCLLLVRQPPVGQGHLIHEVSRSHTTTHHSRRTTLDE